MYEQDLPSTFGGWLKQQRKTLSLTQKRLAQKVGCASVTIRHIESGIFRPSEHMVERILKVLDVPEESHAPIVQLARSISSNGSEDETTNKEKILRNPYKGLRAFEEADTEDFFGRSSLVECLLHYFDSSNDTPSDSSRPKRSRQSTLVSPQRFLAVVGPSGSGKSSVVRAGLLPAIREGKIQGSEDWLIADMYPGAYPMEELRVMLRGLGIDHRVLSNPPKWGCPAVNDGDSDVLLPETVLCLLDTLLKHKQATGVLILIDQFEEVFTLCTDDRMRQHFFDIIVAAATNPQSHIRIVLTLRADFYDRPLRYHGIGELVQQYTEVVLPLSPEELEQAIVGPAQQVGLEMQHDLVKAMVWDVMAQPGSLPLLQYALTELFEQRENHSLLLTAYEHNGRIMGALARRADMLYENLTPSQQKATRLLFLRLVTPGDGTEDTRRRVRIDELIDIQQSDDEDDIFHSHSAQEGNPHHTRAESRHTSVADHTNPIEIVLDVFSRYRLITFDHDPVSQSGTIEVAHEALIGSWGRLRRWVDTHRKGLRIHRALTEAANRWEQLRRDEGVLYRGALLANALEWEQTDSDYLNALERQFLTASREAVEKAEREREDIRQRELAQAQALAEEQQRRAEEQLRRAEAEQQRAEEQAIATRKLRQRAFFLTIAVVIALVAALFAGIFGVRSQQYANDVLEQRSRAEQHAMQAQGLALSSEAQIELDRGDPNYALSLALAATYKNQDIPRIDILLSDAAYTAARSVFEGHTEGIRDVAFSPNGRYMLSASVDKTIHMWDINGGTDKQPVLQRIFDGHTDAIYSVSFSPDGNTALSASRDTTIRLWDVATGEEIRQFEGHSDAVYCAVFSPDGRHILSASRDKTIRLWDVISGKEIRRFEGHTDAVWSVTFSPDGRSILSASHDFTMRLWDVATGKEIRLFDDWVNSMAFSPDGKTILSGSVVGIVRLWDVSSGEELYRFQSGMDPVWSVAFSPDGRTALTGTQGAVMRLWDVASGQEIRHFVGHTKAVWSVAFSPSGRQVLSASEDTTMRLWDIGSGAEQNLFVGEEAFPVEQVTFDPNGTDAFAWSADGVLRWWDVSSKQTSLQQTHRVTETEQENNAVQPEDREAQFVTERTTPLPLEEQEGDQHLFEEEVIAVGGMDISPDGKYVVASSNDSTIWIWNREITSQQQKPQQRLEGHTDWVNSVAFSPDGTMLISAANDKSMILWDVASGEVIRRFDDDIGRVQYVVFSPDGQRFLSASDDSIVRLWDVASGEELRRYVGHSGRVSSVAFSPDGRFVLSGSFDRSIRLWDIERGTELLHMEIPAKVSSVTFSPDGTTALSGGYDGSVRLWDMENGTELRRFWGHTGSVYSVAFSPDGLMALSGATDGTTRLWRIDSTMEMLEEWIATHRWIPKLSCEHRLRYQVLPLCEDR